MPLEMTKTMADTIKSNAPSLVVAETGQIGSDNVIMNHKKPPFDNVLVRRAVSLAMDRHAYVQGVRYNGAVVGAALMPKPWGTWGLLDKDVKALPGYRSPAVDKAEARRLLAQTGTGPGKPLRLELTTRAIAIYVDLASFVADQLRQVGVEATVKQLDTAQYFPALARREFMIGANLTAGAFDDPDAYLFENYKCGTARNYTDYCSEEMDQLIDQQSEELDRDKRLKRVWEIQRRLEADVARPMLGWRTEYFTRWPYVKNLVPHNSLYNYARTGEPRVSGSRPREARRSRCERSTVHRRASTTRRTRRNRKRRPRAPRRRWPRCSARKRLKRFSPVHTISSTLGATTLPVNEPEALVRTRYTVLPQT